MDNYIRGFLDDIDKLEKPYLKKKQDSFTVTMIDKVLRIVAPGPTWANEQVAGIGAPPDWEWFNETIEGFPVRMGSCLAPDGVALTTLITQFETSRVGKDFRQLEETYPDKPIVLIVKLAGRKFKELVVSESGYFDPVKWELILVKPQVSICELADFEKTLKRDYRAERYA